MPAVAANPNAAVDDTDLFAQGMEHYEGDGAFDESRDLAPLELAFAGRFARPLPISAEGETEVHRALGFDHRGRVDVAVDPSRAGRRLAAPISEVHRIPYYAFTHAIPGKATAAHVHIGPGSTRLATPVSTRLANSARPQRRLANGFSPPRIPHRRTNPEARAGDGRRRSAPTIPRVPSI